VRWRQAVRRQQAVRLQAEQHQPSLQLHEQARWEQAVRPCLWKAQACWAELPLLQEELGAQHRAHQQQGQRGPQERAVHRVPSGQRLQN